jgi:MFS family permease
MAESPANRSYRALLAVPSLPRILLGMQIARIAQMMVSIALVLFTLDTYHSAPLAGLVTFASTFPSVLASPLAGALLDRHGRTWLVVADYLVACLAMLLIGGLALAGVLQPWMLVAIGLVSALTNPLSAAGLRSLLPILVPRHLWERANAVDSNGYVMATVIGPPVAGLMVEVWGGAVALTVIGILYAVAAVVLLRIHDPKTETASTGSIVLDAWNGLRYTLLHPTLRGLGISVSTLNLAGGAVNILLPLIVLNRLHQGEAVVGLLFAVSGVFGMGAAFFSGRLNTVGRERGLLVWPMVVFGLSLLLLLPSDGLLLPVLAMAISGLTSGPLDIALFTVRQRRTDPAWMGRAFAVSMSINFLGFPIGSALTGWLATESIELAVLFAVAACFVAAVLARLLIPLRDDRATHGPPPSSTG